MMYSGVLVLSVYSIGNTPVLHLEKNIWMYNTHSFLMVKNPGKKGAHYIHRITVHVTVILTVVEVVHVVVTSKI